MAAKKRQRRSPKPTVSSEQARLYEEVSSTLNIALLNSGMSQAELARQLGVEPSTVSRAINLDRDMKLSNIAALAFKTGHRIFVTLEPLDP